MNEKALTAEKYVGLTRSERYISNYRGLKGLKGGDAKSSTELTSLIVRGNGKRQQGGLKGLKGGDATSRTELTSQNVRGNGKRQQMKSRQGGDQNVQ